MAAVKIIMLFSMLVIKPLEIFQNNRIFGSALMQSYASLKICLQKICICTSNLSPVIINMHANKNLQSGNVFLITFNKHASSDSLNTRGWRRGCCFLSNFKFRSSNFFLPFPSFFLLSVHRDQLLRTTSLPTRGAETR